MSNAVLSRLRNLPITPLAASTTPATLTVDPNFTMPSGWVELTPTTGLPLAANGVWLHYFGTTSAHRHRLNISKGATAGDTMLVENLILTGAIGHGYQVFLPIAIERGARVWIQSCSSHTSSTTAYAYLGANPEIATVPRYPSRLFTFNVNTATHAPQVFCDAGATVNTKPSTYTEIIAAAPIRATVALVHAMANSTSNGGSRFAADFAVGGSGAEVLRVGNVFFQQGGTTFATATQPPLFLPIPLNRGERLAARVQSSSASSLTRELGFIFYIG